MARVPLPPAYIQIRLFLSYLGLHVFGFITDTEAFIGQLKTHYFKPAFNLQTFRRPTIILLCLPLRRFRENGVRSFDLAVPKCLLA